MTRDDIYEHLAQVYLGKKQKNKADKKQQFSAWLVINIIITFVIFASSFYGLTAFLARRANVLHDKVIYALNKGPIRIKYQLGFPYPSVHAFSLAVPRVDVVKYSRLQFSIRGLEEGYPKMMRVEIRNRKDEVSSVFIDDINLDWKDVNINLERFKNISDWSNVAEISFVLEAWNAHKPKGIILIDNVCFAS